MKKRKKLEGKKEINNKLIKDRIIRNIRTLWNKIGTKYLEQNKIWKKMLEQEEDYYKPKRVNYFWNNNYIEYESNGDKNGNLSLDEYLNKIKPYLRNIIIDFQNSDTGKIQLTIATDLISSKDVKDVEEVHVMHSTSNNIKFTSYNDKDEVVGELFESLQSRYKGNLETSMPLF